MTTEIQPITIPTKHTENHLSTTSNYIAKLATKLEENRGNVIKPLSLRPNRSIKKNNSLKPLGLRSR